MVRPNRPFYKQSVLAGSACNVGWNSRNAELDQVELSTVRYRIDDMTNGIEIQGWTEVEDDPLPAKGEITIPASVNGMQRTYNDTELRQVRFELTDTDGGIKTQTAYYELISVWEP